MSTTQYIIKQGDKFSPFTGKAITYAPGTVIYGDTGAAKDFGTSNPSSGGSPSTPSGGGFDVNQASYVTKPGDLYNPYTGTSLGGATPGTTITNPNTPFDANQASYTVKQGDQFNPYTGASLGGAAVGSVVLNPASAPNNASQVNGLPSVNMPGGTPTSGNVSNAMATSSGLTQFYNVQAQQDKANADAYLKQIQLQQNSPEAKASQSFLQKLLGSESPSQVRDDAFKQTGINPQNYFAEEKQKIAEIDSLTQQYNALQAQKDQAKATASGKMASNSFINNQIAQIDRNAAPAMNQLSADINAKAAMLQASQGMFAEAQKFVDQAVQDATAEQKFNYDMFNEFYSINQDSIDRLDKKYQTALQSSKDNAEKAWTNAVNEKTQIGDLMLKNPQAGIDISNDTLESALKKIGQHPATSGQIIGSADSGYTNVITDSSGKIVSQQSVKGGSGGGGGGGGSSGIKLTATQSNKGALNAGLSTSQFSSLPPDVQNFYANSSAANMKDIQTLISDAKSGKVSYQDAISAIDGAGISGAVADYLKSQIPQSSASTKTPLFGNPFAGSGNAIQNFGTNLWGGITNLFK